MEFKILGTLEVTANGTPQAPTAPKVRQLLATLLVRANQFVSVDALVDEMWGEDPPARVVTTIQTYVHYLRKMLAKGAGPEPRAGLRTEAQGYVLRVCRECLDATAFDEFAQQAGRLFEAHQHAEASWAARKALALWRGPVASGIAAGPILQARAAHLEEVKLQTLDIWIQAEILLGRHRQIMPELRSLVIAYPLNERLHAHLIGALNQAGRRAEALDAYQNYRHLLGTTLGLEPSQELRELQRAVLIGN
jgi:DNA-binding SARP family transcriptional activator